MSHDELSNEAHSPLTDGGHGGRGYDARLLHGGIDAAANPPPPGAVHKLTY